MTRLHAYLSFKDNARQAMEFYKSVFGGKLRISTFKDFHAAQNPGEENMVMHSELDANNGLSFMASDTPDRIPYTGCNPSLSLSGENPEELSRYFNKLSAGGKIEQPLAKAPWGDTYGSIEDKFGVRWLVDIITPKK